ncbi:MAG: spondin domain-containing protein, partial [Gammaproteobacteria bacterium]|nr:spondin domain-containing protein [Gammaproteobacteria bacterium]
MLKSARLSVLGLVFFSAAAALGSAKALADNGSRVEVTITNLTRGQIISPVVVASHTGRFEPLFQLGSPASGELAAVAEDAMLDPLITALSTDPDVYDVETVFGVGGPIMPGESASVVVEVRGRFRLLSMAGMLVTTNDAFFALRGVRVPSQGSRIHYSPAYDAGSEANNEDCNFIP